MRIIKPEKLRASGMGANESFFLDLWYSMTHQRSLDSYRVKCLNSRTIVRELSEELVIARIKPENLKDLCLEVKIRLEEDPVITANFGAILKKFLPYLAMPPQIVDDKNKKPDPEKVEDFKFIAKDFNVLLEKQYWELLKKSLHGEIKSGNKDNLKVIVGNVLSDLIDKGWLIETLFQWHSHFLSEKNLREYGFEKNLDFMLKFFSREFQDFEVTLRLVGSDKLADVKTYADFTFSKDPAVSEKSPKRFLRKSEYVCFAQANIKGADFSSAAINAKEGFDQFIDLFRFDFEPSTLKIDPNCHVKRLTDGKIEYPTIKSVIPNPAEAMDHSGFLEFINDLKTISGKTGVNESSKRKIRGAIRQYRFGRDNENFKDKFLNWWLGLESLCYTGKGDIGETVTRNASFVMAVNYIPRLLEDALSTIKYADVESPKNLEEVCGKKEICDLSLDDLLRVIQSPPHVDELLKQCEISPIMHYRCRILFNALSSPAETTRKIEAHMSNLLWQISRLYRVRCCIVHGSDIRFRLGLFVANLEFYLKQVILYLLDTFEDNNHISDLDEIYNRSNLFYTRSLSDLKTNGSGAEQIRNLVFPSIVN